MNYLWKQAIYKCIILSDNLWRPISRVKQNAERMKTSTATAKKPDESNLYTRISSAKLER